MKSYSQRSFTVTDQPGETVSFSFNGTGVEVFGAKRGNHGLYRVTVDGRLQPTGNGHANDPGEFQTPLFSLKDLNQGFHQLIMTNQESLYLDIDFVGLVA